MRRCGDFVPRQKLKIAPAPGGAKHEEGQAGQAPCCRGWQDWISARAQDLGLSVSSSFDLKAGKDTARNKCLGHGILSM